MSQVTRKSVKPPKRRLHNGQHSLDFLGEHELIVDNFAGGGGASSGIEKAFGRKIDIAINHDPEAIALHKANHPDTEHHCESVWDVDPREVTKGRPVGLAWFSPDCKHFSKAKGSTPVNKNIRGLAWVAIRWASTVRPRIIMLENVEEFKTWGPLDESNQPDKSRTGETFSNWKSQLVELGYQVEHKELIAADYGAPTIRKRLFLIARCDGNPITWPEQTHTNPDILHSAKLKHWRPASECIDFSIPVKSIFERKKPLADNTMKRIARGIQRFVIDTPKPFILRNGQTEGGANGVQHPISKPLTTAVSKSENCLVVPWVIKHFTGATGSSMSKPVPTLMGSGSQNQYAHVILAPTDDIKLGFITQFNRTNIGTGLDKPLNTLRSGGNAFGLVQVSCSAKVELGEAQSNFYGFITKYYSQGTGSKLDEPMHTVATKDRFGLVIVEGVEHQIIDIGMRMLTPREQFLAQGFDPDYKIDIDYNGKPLTKKAQQRMCGNSVSPVMSFNLVKANLSVQPARRSA